MMKNIFKTLTFAALFSLICSCTNTDVDDAYNQGYTTLSASLSTETRTAYSGDKSVDVVWSEDDAITLYGSDGNLYQLSLYEGAGTSTALFICYNKLPTDVTYVAVYPASTAQTLEAREAEWQTNLKSQTISSLEDGKLSKYAAMKGEVVNSAVNFEQETFLFRAVFDDTTIPNGQVSISDSANEDLNITLTIDSAAEGTTLYAAALPGDYSSVTLYTVDYGFVKDINATLSAGKVISLNLGEDDSVDDLSFSSMVDEDGVVEYNITSAADLKLLSDKVSKGFTYEGATFKMTRNIDLGGFDSNGDPIEDNQWIPIGSSTTNFKATFDGCGYEVSGIYINNTSNYQGLFGYVSSGSILNLGVSGTIIGDSYVGGVVGCSSFSTSSSSITNCYNTGDVIGSSYIGGVVGYSYSTTNCYNTGDVTGSSRVGGVVGFSFFATNCYCLDSSCENVFGFSNIINVNSKTKEEMQSIDFLDILNSGAYQYNKDYPTSTQACAWKFSLDDGYPIFDLDNAPSYKEYNYYSSGSGTESDPYKISTVDDLTNIATYIGLNNHHSNVYFKMTNNIDLGGDENNQWLPIGNGSCEFEGNFDGGGYEVSGLYIDFISSYKGLFGYVGDEGKIENLGVAGAIFGGAYIGGIVGYNMGIISNCYNTSEVNGSSNLVGGVVGCSYSSITNCYNTGEVNGSSSYVGGVVGWSYSSVTNCYNTGEVNGSSSVGGVVGWSSYSSVTNCYNTGEVNGSSNYVGGVVGRSYSSYSHSSYSSSSVANCYNIGEVNGSSSYVGGVIGHSSTSSSVTNCYYLDTLTGFTSSYRETQTEENMKSADFVTTLNNGGTDWQSDFTPNINSGFPILSWQE